VSFYPSLKPKVPEKNVIADGQLIDCKSVQQEFLKIHEKPQTINWSLKNSGLHKDE